MRTTRNWTILQSPLDSHHPSISDGAFSWASAALLDVWTPKMATFAASLPIPVINVVHGGSADFPTVCVDNRAIGRMAFEHLRSLGLIHFAYLPWASGTDNLLRQEGFLDAAKAAGFERNAQVLETVLSTSDWTRDIARQGEILKMLPRPTGILCFADWLAALAIHAARSAGISLPEDLAIMGVDDDDIVCESARPALTSIDVNYERVGFEAARLVIAIAEGANPPRKNVLIQPIGVIERASTQVLATDDEDVAAAIRFIQKHDQAGIRITAEEVAAVTIISRRGLDGKFCKLLGHTVAAEISHR